MLKNISSLTNKLLFFCRDGNNDTGDVRVYPGKLQVSQAFCTVPVDSSTTVADLIKEALKRFGLNDTKCEDYRCSEVLLDRGGIYATQFQRLWNSFSPIYL